MSRIKTRESVKDIKVIDKAAVASERMKTALVRSKDQFENLMDDGQVTPSEYAEDKIRYAAEDVADRVGHDVSAETKKAVNKGKEAYRKHREEKRIEKNEERVNRCIQTASCLSEAKLYSAEEECPPAEHRQRDSIHRR